jgi:hypothetical protein
LRSSWSRQWSSKGARSLIKTCCVCVWPQVSGDFGELEEPTPWEMQEAIQRIKERERRRGTEAARAEMAAFRSYEAAEMQQRVSAAMQRIGGCAGRARAWVHGRLGCSED